MGTTTPSVAAQQVNASNMDQARWAKICKRYPPLSRDEERSLVVHARAGDGAARQKLLNHNLSWCVHAARKLALGGAPFDDVVQEGVSGLIRALETFDVGRGLRFSTYAMWWIRVREVEFLRSARSVVVPRCNTNAAADFSLDAPIGDDDSDAAHLDLLEDDGGSPEEKFISSDHDRHVHQALGQLRKRIGDIGWDIIHNRLCKNAGEEDILEIIGNRHGVSRERIRQVEMKTVALLRRTLPEMLTVRERMYQEQSERGATVAPTPVEVARRKLACSSSPTAQKIATEAVEAARAEEEEETTGLLMYPAGPRDPRIAEPCPAELIVAHVHRVFPNLAPSVAGAAIDVAQGLKLKHAATKRNVAISTAHIHRKRLFAATDTHARDEVTSTLLAAALQQLAGRGAAVERCEVKMADAEDGEVPGVMHVPAPADGFDLPVTVSPPPTHRLPIRTMLDQKIIARAAHLLLPTPDDDITAHLKALRAEVQSWRLRALAVEAALETWRQLHAAFLVLTDKRFRELHIEAQQQYDRAEKAEAALTAAKPAKTNVGPTGGGM